MATTDEISAPLLSIRGLVKSFGGTRALSDVDLDVAPGEVHGLLGENGSGKSTMIKVLAGFHVPDAGELALRGTPVPLPLAPGQFRALGMEFVHQDLGLIPTVSVLENLRMGALASRRGPRPIMWRSERRDGQQTLARYGVDLDVTKKVQDLRPVEQALVAIVRGVEDMQSALADAGHSQGLLFLDEPTAFLPRDQVDQLFELIRRIVRTGASVVFVSHDLDEVCQITDQVTVLRNGRNAGTVQTATTSIEDLVELIVGRDLGEVSAPSAVTGSRELILTARDLAGDSLEKASLDLYSGEVLGVTGLVGSGFEEFPYILFGVAPARRGTLSLFGEEVELTRISPRWSIQRGSALIPGDRQHDGSIGSLSVTDNMMSLMLDNYYEHGVLNRSRLRRDAALLMDRYDIRPREPDLPYSSFSGGNQQKALMAKWLQCKPRVLLLHEPTQGVDVGARLTIFNVIRDAAANGAAVICASSDYEQLAMICDRVLVVGQGRIIQELTGPKVTKDYITEQCLLSAGATPSQRTAREVGA